MADANKNDQQETMQLIHEAVEKMEGKVSPKFLPMVEETLIKVETEGLTPQEAMEISDDVVDEIYEHGYHFFKSGKFKDALAIFNVLNQLVGGSDLRYVFAIAATHHHMKNYPEAAGYYMLYEALHPADPIPYYHLYDCFRKTNNLDLAENALRAALKLAEKDAKYEDLKAKIEIELKQVQSEATSGSQEKQSTVA